ncbi:MAG TPA: alpha/beta fold hydrolase [Burkholderiales bacterium]|nr:alpha/beta fold hydrolase [Burkholderiales bacterium]
MSKCGWYRWFFVLFLALAAGCSRLPSMQPAPVRAKSVAELQDYLRSHKADIDLFRLRGPFAVGERGDVELRLSPKERVYADVYLSSAPEKAPVVLLVHGYDSSKEAHANQAVHMASWGMHVVAVQLPKRGPWGVSNGRILARVASLIHRSPEVVDARVDPNKIVLAGHSFGGNAVAIALGEGAPALGGILLDPAAVGRDTPKILQQITRPVMVLGADEHIGATRNREYFYRYVRSGIGEVSIKDATHEDGQYPSQYALQHYGSDPYTSEEAQLSFAAAMTASAMSLATTGGFDSAWTSFDPEIKSGKFFNAKRK